MLEEKLLCCECDAPVTWFRHTQFAGNHPYCTACAEREEDFGKDDDYFYWAELPAEVIARKHPTEVKGYEGRLDELVRNILGMRYDRVAEIHRHIADEWQRQAEGDRAKNREQVATLLAEIAWCARQQETRIRSLWDLCEPHMRDEEKK